MWHRQNVGKLCRGQENCPSSRTGKIGGMVLIAGFMLLTVAASVQAQVSVEDHSLPKSAVKTYHVKCSNGRLGMVRYDTRKSLVTMCVSVQDGSRPQSCVSGSPEQAQGHVQKLAQWVCQ